MPSSICILSLLHSSKPLCPLSFLLPFLPCLQSSNLSSIHFSFYYSVFSLSCSPHSFSILFHVLFSFSVFIFFSAHHSLFPVATLPFSYCFLPIHISSSSFHSSNHLIPLLLFISTALHSFHNCIHSHLLFELFFFYAFYYKCIYIYSFTYALFSPNSSSYIITTLLSYPPQALLKIYI